MVHLKRASVDDGVADAESHRSNRDPVGEITEQYEQWDDLRVAIGSDGKKHRDEGRDVLGRDSSLDRKGTAKRLAIVAGRLAGGNSGVVVRGIDTFRNLYR